MVAASTHWAQDVKRTSNERRIQVRPTKTIEERLVNVESLRRINVIFGRNADVLSSSLLVLNV